MVLRLEIQLRYKYIFIIRPSLRQMRSYYKIVMQFKSKSWNHKKKLLQIRTMVHTVQMYS